MATPPSGKKPIAIRWKDYIPTPKRHQVYLWLGSAILVIYLGYMLWESYQSPRYLPDRIYNTGVYLLIGVLLLLRGLRVHFLRHAWFIEIDELTIRYRMVQWSKAQHVMWKDIAKIRIAFEQVYLYLKDGKTRRVNLENVPDEMKVEETKKAIIQFGRTHSIPVTK